MSGRDRDSGKDASQAGRVPGLDHFPLPADRQKRLEVLVDLHRRGLWRPDYEKLANALLEKEPGLFGFPPEGAAPDTTGNGTQGEAGLGCAKPGDRR